MKNQRQNQSEAQPTNASSMPKVALLPRRSFARIALRMMLACLVVGGFLVLACEPPSVLRPGLTACPGAPGGVDVQRDPVHCQGCGKACNDGQICGPDGCAWCPETRPSRCSNPDAQDWKDCFDLNASAEHCGTCGTRCTGGKTCQGGACACPPGQSLCGATCIDLRVDGKNCGKCGVACGANASCFQGSCIDQTCASISERLKLCGGGCVNIKTDPAHCGTCGNACGARQRCAEGTCECLPGTERCGEACVDLRTHWENCGACGSACKPGQVCTAGKCEAFCPEATPHHCQGGCFHTDFSSEHCGKCGNRCLGGSFCEQGACVCEPGSLLCNGRCVDAQNDPLHCGKCGERCDGICSQGVCGICLDKARQCGDDCCEKADCCSSSGKLRCIDTQSNPNHCGVCDNKCDPGKACIAGVCEGAPACDTGKTRCGADCVDLQSDAQHCGKCSSPCAAGESCSAGVCGGSATPQWPITFKSTSGVLQLNTMLPGSVVVSGFFSGTIVVNAKSYTSKSFRTPFLGKWSDQGQLLWLVTIDNGVVFHDTLAAIGPKGEVVLVGAFAPDATTPTAKVSFGNDMLTPNSNSNLFVASFDTQGQLQGALGVEGDGEGNFTSAVFGSDGQLYIAGFLKGKIKFGTTTLDGGVDGKPFLVSVDTQKKVFSYATLLPGGEYSNTPNRLVIRAHGDALYIATFFRGTLGVGQSTVISRRLEAIYVAKWNTKDRGFLWAVSVGDVSPNTIRLEVDAQGDVYVASSFLGQSVFFHEEMTPFFDVGAGARGRSLVVCKIDANGKFVWGNGAIGRSLPSGTGQGDPSTLVVTPLGLVRLGVAISGGTLEFTQTLQLTGGKSPSTYMLALDSNGKWEESWSPSLGSGGILLRASFINAQDEIVIGGSHISGASLSATEKLPTLQAGERGLFLWKFKKP